MTKIRPESVGAASMAGYSLRINAEQVISEKSVSEILEAAQIEDVVKDHVSLKRRGSNLIGLCPFHNEKTPSFSISPSKNIYKCFGCGEGGTPVNFLMEYLQLSYPEALRNLARRYNIDIEETEDSDEVLAEKQERESLYLLNAYARDFFSDQMWNTGRGKSVGLAYFKDRGFREETIRKFELGYAPGSGHALKDKALAKGYSADHLEELGLVKKGRDFFRDRVIFTIHNLTGKVVGFAGRILTKDPKAPKYVNSPESSIYHKSKVLFGAHQARRAIRKEDTCILVEGYTDVISLHQAGIENVVATSGTSLTHDQIQLIRRQTENVLMLFDGDAAGTRAALRGLDMVLEQGLNVKLVMLPEGEDPDSYVRENGPTVFREYLGENAKDFILFKADLLLREVEGDPVRKTEAIREIVSSMARIPDPIKRNLYIRECARLVDVEEQLLVNETNQAVSRLLKERRRRDPNPAGEEPEGGQMAPPSQRTAVPQPARPGNDFFQEKDLLRVLVCYGDRIFDEEDGTTVAHFILENISDVMDHVHDDRYMDIFRSCSQRLEEGLPVSPAYFKAHPDPKVAKMAIDLLASPYEYSSNWEDRWDVVLQTQKMPDENFRRDAMDSLKKFKLRKIRKVIFEQAEALKDLRADQDEDIRMALRIHSELKRMEVELARELGLVVY